MLDEAEHDGRVVLGREGEHLVLVLATRHVEDPGARREARPDDRRLVGLHRDHGLLGQGLDHRDQRRHLGRRVDPVGASGARLGADVDDVGTLRDLDAGLPDRRVGRDRHALAVRRAAGQVDRAHQGRRFVADDRGADVDGCHGCGELAAIGVPQGGEVVERDHRGESRVCPGVPVRGRMTS